MNTVKRWKLWAVMAVLTAAVFLYEGNMLTARAEATATVTADSAKIRSEASTGSEAVGSTTKGTKLPILKSVSASDGIWYQVTVEGNTTGYIRSDLVSTTGEVPAAGGTETKKPTVTNSEVRASDMTAGVITGNSVNVRKGAASSDALAGVLKKDAVVKITGETDGADGKLWYQIESDTVNGFIRSDLLEASAAVATEGGEEQPTETPEEPEAPAEEGDTTTVSNVVSVRTLPEGVDLETAGLSAETIKGWESDRYYVIYTQTKSGAEQWYFYDAQSNAYDRIDDLTPMTEEEIKAAEGGKMNKPVLIVGIVLLVAMLGVIIYLALQLHEYKMDYEYDDDYDDDDDGYYEDYEEGKVNSRAWKPKNFLGRDSDEDDFADEEDEPAYRKPAEKAKPEVRQRPARAEKGSAAGAGSQARSSQARSSQARGGKTGTKAEGGAPGRRPETQEPRLENGASRRPSSQPAGPQTYDDAEDEDFEFEFLNMNDEDYID